MAMLCASSMWAQTKMASKKDATQPSVLIWPLPPDPPRLRWLTEYKDMAKLNSGAVRKRGWLEKVTGSKTPEERLELRKPYGITTDSKGRIYVADMELHSVFVVDPAAKIIERRQGNSGAPLVMPAGVAIDSEDRLFVSDAQFHSITCFSPGGDVIARFGTNYLGRPGGITIDKPHNRLYTADAKESRIAVFNTRSFEFQGYWGKPSISGKPEKGTFSSPSNVAVDRQGNLYVADTLNCRIQILNATGEFVRTFGVQGDNPGEFIRPKGIAVDSEGHIYVADAEFNNFQVFSADGQPLLAVGTLGTAPGEFALIAGMHIDARDRIYTTEMYVGRIQVFQYIAQPASAGGQASGKPSQHP